MKTKANRSDFSKYVLARFFPSKWTLSRYFVFAAILLPVSGTENLTGKDLNAYLNGKKYQTDMGFWKSLEFAAGKFQIGSMQMLEESGPYSVRGNKVFLSSGTACTAIWNSKSVAYTEELDCGSKGRFFLDSSRRQDGSDITIYGEPAEVFFKHVASLTTHVVFRKRPSKKGAPLRCPDGTSPLVPGMNMTIYARTKQKVKVDRWENYWYYVYNNYSPEGAMNMETGQAFGCEAPAGWVFGEFVKFD